MTKLLYLQDFSLLRCDARVVDVFEEEGRNIVVLDQTVFYPQGGGQPYDTGIIEGPSGKFIVEEVRFVEGIVKHIGKFGIGTIATGNSVKCEVDKERRILNSKLHSAGHLVDLGVWKLDLAWIPGKGYHFPNGPYVEYAGNLDGVDKEKLKEELEAVCNELVKEGWEVKIVFTDKEKMKELCRFVPDNIPTDKPSRVIMFGDFGVPCGGTHVPNSKDIGSMTIRKIKNEKGNIKVGYGAS